MGATTGMAATRQMPSTGRGAALAFVRHLALVASCSAAAWVTSAHAHDLPCEASDPLSEVAALLLLDGGDPTPASLTAAAREVGFGGLSLHASRLTDDADLARWLRAIAHREDAQLVCGEAHSARGRMLVAAPRGGHLQARGDRVFVQLGPGFSTPSLVVQGAEGRPRRLPVDATALRDGVRLPDDMQPPLRVQLVAEGPAGPRPVAELTVMQGADTGALLEVTRLLAAPAPAPVAADVSVAGPPQKGLRSQLDAFRRHFDAPALRMNVALERSAERHARRVCELGQVAHRLSPDDDPVARLARERIQARAVGEAIGRSSSPAAAMAAIFDSPSHRHAVSERRFTDVGIGHARDRRGRSCVVVLLAAWPRRLP